MKNKKLKIVGIADEIVISKYKLSLNVNASPNDIILFCDYSNMDISIGYLFNHIEDPEGVILFSGAIRLKKVSQEFMLSYDQIPKGHKSICKFNFEDSNIPKALLSLPKIKDWYESNMFLYFVN